MDARHVLEITRRMHALATTPEGALLTLVELERLAAEQIAAAVVAGGPRERERKMVALLSGRLP